MSGTPLDPEAQARLDAMRDFGVRFLMHHVPTEPGVYEDRAGDRWVLDTDGTWTDCNGEARDAEQNWMLAVVAPFTPLGSGKYVFRVIREKVAGETVRVLLEPYGMGRLVSIGPDDEFIPGRLEVNPWRE